MVYDQLYLGRTIDEEHSPVQTSTTVICSRGIDGNVADVYGETPEQSRLVAEQIVSALSWLCDDDLLKRFCKVNGAAEVARSIQEHMFAQHPLPGQEMKTWEELSQQQREVAAKVAYDLLRDFSVFALAYNRNGELIGVKQPQG